METYGGTARSSWLVLADRSHGGCGLRPTSEAPFRARGPPRSLARANRQIGKVLMLASSGDPATDVPHCDHKKKGRGNAPTSPLPHTGLAEPAQLQLATLPGDSPSAYPCSRQPD
jgi:hypothetical protein